MNKKIFSILLAISVVLGISVPGAASVFDSVPSGFKLPAQWRIGADASYAYVFSTNGYLGGENPMNKKVQTVLPLAVKADFSFNPESKEGILYRGLYEGIGIGAEPFMPNSLTHTPVTAFVYQGMPIVHLRDDLWFGYEWKFGAAMGWRHYDASQNVNMAAVSTSVTAMMVVGFKFNYSISPRSSISFGIECQHFSNGNTSWPNVGVNTLGANVGFSYILNPHNKEWKSNPQLEDEADRGKWFYDVMAYGAWRKRDLMLGDPEIYYMLPQRFAVAGLQFMPLRSLCRYIGVGPSLDLQWDRSAGLSPYWTGEIADETPQFRKPPFGKQISVGVSARAELSMPIFSVNAGVGLNIVNPKGDKRFYQILTIKTFLTRNIYINVGYSLGEFKSPRSLQLGLGMRLQ